MVNNKLYLQDVRDKFAGMAMVELMKNDPNPWSVARKAYEMADVMLEVRSETILTSVEEMQ